MDELLGMLLEVVLAPLDAVFEWLFCWVCKKIWSLVIGGFL